MNLTHPNPAFPAEADGLVVTYFSDFYNVRKRNGMMVQCKRKALLKKQGLSVVVGDFVTLEETESDMGWITGILPPSTQLTKPKIHNISHVLIACPWQEPSLDLRQMDRLLCKVQLAGLTPLLVLSKADLQPTQPQYGFTLAQWQHYYTHHVGVPTLVTSIYDSTRIDELKAYLKGIGGRWVLAGVSGAGKSSLLNAIDEHLKLRVNELSSKGGRGTHTTRHTELLETLDGLLIADAPGFSQLDFSGEAPTALHVAFPEFQQGKTPQTTCAYEDCLHVDEAGCQVKDAVARKTILNSRYTHYVELVKEAQAGEHLRLAQSQKTEHATKQVKSKKGGKAVHVVKLNPELRQANRKENRQSLKKLEQQIQQFQRLEEGLDYDESPLNDEEF
jgi:ribosome biogenesis GTPase / thiamine phosphate phosphatase